MLGVPYGRQHIVSISRIRRAILRTEEVASSEPHTAVQNSGNKNKRCAHHDDKVLYLGFTVSTSLNRFLHKIHNTGKTITVMATTQYLVKSHVIAQITEITTRKWSIFDWSVRDWWFLKSRRGCVFLWRWDELVLRSCTGAKFFWGWWAGF